MECCCGRRRPKETLEPLNPLHDISDVVVDLTEPEPEPDGALVHTLSGPAFPNKGITLEGLEAFLSSYEREITETTTTSDVCHATVKILTVTPGWTCVATLINPEKSWYKHQYVNNETGEKRDTSPAGSSSYLDLLQKDPQTAVYVGRPTIFLSHAWTYKFRNLLAALRS